MPSEHPVQLRSTDLDAQLCFALYAATNVVTRAYRPLLEPLGITYPQYLVLLVLWHEQHEGSCTPGELAGRLQLGSHAITPLVDRLAAAGLVTRRRDRRDRRVIHVVLTDRGRALEPEVADVQRQVGCQLMSGDDEIGRLRSELQQLVVRMTTADPAGTDAVPPTARTAPTA